MGHTTLSQANRKAPPFAYRSERGFRSQIPLLDGTRNGQPLLVNVDKTLALEWAEVWGAMKRRVEEYLLAGKIDRHHVAVAAYCRDGASAKVVTLPTDFEVPAALQLELDSWRRTIQSGNARDARGHLKLACRDVFRVLRILKTEHPALYAGARVAAIDTLEELARYHGTIDVDDAQLIISQAAEASPHDETAPAVPASPQAARPSTWRDQIVGAQDLCDQVFAPVRFLVPGLFPEGVALLVSRPKLGKSWLLLQIGSSIANGVSALVSADEPIAGDVLYLSLEDNTRRVQRRMTTHFGALRECWPRRLQIVTTWRRLDQGGLDDLREWCGAAETPTLIMVDTLKKVRPPKKHGQTDYDADYEACEGLALLWQIFSGTGFPNQFFSDL